MTQNLKRNWLVISKLTWRIWQILTRAFESLKNFRKCMTLKFTEELCVMTMKNNTKFEEELTCQFKIDMRNLTNFDLSTRKSQKIFTLMGSFWAKYILFELKKYRGVIFHDIEEWCKIWKKNWLVAWKMTWGIWQIFTGALKCQNWNFYEIPLSKVENVYISLKFKKELCVMTIKNDTKIDEELTCRFKIDMRNFRNFDRSTQKSKKFVF